MTVTALAREYPKNTVTIVMTVMQGTWGGLPGDPDPMVGKASGPLTRLME